MRIPSLLATLALSVSLFGCTAGDQPQPTSDDETGSVVSAATVTGGYCYTGDTVVGDTDEWSSRTIFTTPSDVQHIALVYTRWSNGLFVWAIGDGARVMNVFHVKYADQSAFSAAAAGAYAAWVSAYPGAARLWGVYGTGSGGGINPNPPIGPGGTGWAFTPAFRNRVLHFAQTMADSQNFVIPTLDATSNLR